MELQSVGKRSQRWSPEQVVAFCEKARALGWPSQGLAVQLSYWLTHRQGDVLGITHADLEAEGIQTRKTGAAVPVVVGAYPALVAALSQAELDQAAAVERRRQASEAREAKRATREKREPAPFGEVVPLQVVVCETTGLAWKPDHFRHVFREIAAAAGLPADIQFRDLRATGLTELADAGATDAQRRTHGGHTTAAMALRYARPTPEQFEEAARRRLEHREQKAAGRRNARRNVGTGGGGTA
jgi:hypothetical protein